MADHAVTRMAWRSLRKRLGSSTMPEVLDVMLTGERSTK